MAVFHFCFQHHLSWKARLSFKRKNLCFKKNNKPRSRQFRFNNFSQKKKNSSSLTFVFLSSPPSFRPVFINFATTRCFFRFAQIPKMVFLHASKNIKVRRVYTRVSCRSLSVERRERQTGSQRCVY